MTSGPARLIRVKLDGAAIGRDRFGNAASGSEDVAQVMMGSAIPGIQRDGFVVRFGRLLNPAHFPVDRAEIVVRCAVLGVEIDRRAI